MNIREHLISLIRYNQWANERIIGAIPNDLYDVETPSSFNSIRKTIYHYWGAQEIWYQRVKALPLMDPEDQFTGSTDEMLKQWNANNDAWIAEIDARSDDELSAPITYRNIAGKEFTSRFDEIVMHVCNHATFHRGQIVTMLRSLGVKTIPSTDLIRYFREP